VTGVVPLDVTAGPPHFYTEGDDSLHYWDDTRCFMEDRLVALNNERQRRARIDQLRHNPHRLAHQPPSSPHIGGCHPSDIGGSGGLRSWSDPSRTSCHVSRAGSSMSHVDHSRHNFTNYTPRYQRPLHGGRTGSGRTPSMVAAPGAAASLSGGSPRQGSMSPLRQHRRKPASSASSSGYYSPSIVEQRPPSGRTSAPNRLTSHPLHSSSSNNNNSSKSGRTEMMEKSGFTNTLDLIDGDCVREEAVDYFSSSGGGLTRPSQVARARFGYGPLHPVSGGHGRHKPPLSDTAFSHSQRGGRSKFFENEDDSPLLVSSIDGVSTQVTSRVGGGYGDGSGPSSLGEEEDEGEEGGGGYLLLRSGSQFSLLTPAASPFTLMKMMGEPRGGSGGDVGAGGSCASRLGSVNNLAMVTPYSSIRKRLKSVSMKYLKIMPKLSSGSTSSCSPGGRGQPAASCQGGSTAGSTLSSLGRPPKKRACQVAEFERF
jgi:hypothetical protein